MFLDEEQHYQKVYLLIMWRKNRIAKTDFYIISVVFYNRL